MTIIHCFTFGAAIEGVKGWKESRHCWRRKNASKYISQRSFCLSLFPVDCHPLQLWSFISYDRLGNSGRWTIDENMDICLIATSNMERKNYFLQCLKTLSPLFPKLPSYIWLLFKSFFLNISPEIVPTSVKCSPFNFSNDITNYIDLTGLLFYRVCKNKRRRANSVNFNKNINRWWFTQVTCPKNSFDHPSFICL